MKGTFWVQASLVGRDWIVKILEDVPGEKDYSLWRGDGKPKVFFRVDFDPASKSVDQMIDMVSGRRLMFMNWHKWMYQVGEDFFSFPQLSD